MLRPRIALCFVALMLACSVSCGATHVVSPLVLPSGLQITDWAVGSGAVADTGATVTIDYTIWLLDGKKSPAHMTGGRLFTLPWGSATSSRASIKGSRACGP